MSQEPNLQDSAAASRRQFLRRSTAAAVASGIAAASVRVASHAHAAGDDRLRVGLIGCGGRGTKAAIQALRADPNVQLTAMADAFDDRLQLSLKSLEATEDIAGKLQVPPERQFIGFDAYQQVIDSGVDVVLLTTPPHFRPLHMEAAVAAGVHIFAEKPCAVDAPGVRRVLNTCAEAKQKRLAVVSGLCLRYGYGFQETVQRIHDGQIGEIHTLQANDYRGSIWVKPRQDDWTDMHWQMRNWYYFTWLSGDFNVEQHVHYLDVCAWAMGDTYPVSAIGMGGRIFRTGEMYGNIYDHHSVTYTFANGAKLFSNTRQIPHCATDMSARVVGSKGVASLNEGKRGLSIQAGERWAYEGEDNDIYQTEHDRLFASIRTGNPINNGTYMANSTMLAIMGRMATYTGQLITWEQAMQSQEDLTPPHYQWGPLAMPEVAVPGKTRFV